MLWNRRIILLALLVLLFSVGPAPAMVPLQVGVQGGLSLASASSEAYDHPNLPGLSTRSGFAFGAFATIGLTDMFFLQPEIQYVQRGAELEFGTCTGAGGPEPSGQGRGTFKYDYLAFPLLLMARFETGAFAPFFFAGPDIAFRTNAEVLVECSVTAPQTHSAEEEISTIDFSLDFGAGVAYHLTPTVSISINGRYNVGLTNINELVGPSWKSRGGQILAAIGVAI